MINWLVPRWSRFSRESDAIELKLGTTHTHDVPFGPSGIDLAILTDCAEYGGCLVELLFTASLVPVCSPTYLPPGTLATDSEDWCGSLLHSEIRPNDWKRWAAANGDQRIDPYRGHRFESSKLM